MKALSRAIDKFCQKHRKFGIPRLMTYIVIISAAVFIVHSMDTTGTLLNYLVFSPARVLRGEVWRLVTWIFCPLSGSLLTTALMLYFYFFIGRTLEREWGTTKFTVYYILCVLLNLIYATAAWLIFNSVPYLVPSYLNLAMFFAFAVLFPDQVMLLFFIIPIKIKWLALLNAAVFLFSIIADIVAGQYLNAVLPIIALLGFFAVCGDDLLFYLRPARSRGFRQPINFKKAAKSAKRQHNASAYRHKCAVCGKTDSDNPELEFRYCSRCDGYHCFCIEHINNHIHFH